MSNPLSPPSGFTFQSDTPHPVEQMLQRMNQMAHLRMEARARELEAAQRAETGSVNRCPECGTVLQPGATGLEVEKLQAQLEECHKLQASMIRNMAGTPAPAAANRLETDLARAMDLIHKATAK